MSKEALLALCHEAEVFVDSGAPAAIGASRLQQKAKTVADLAAKVASLKPLSEATQKLIAANPKSAPEALLPLLSMCRQLRASIAGNGAVGEMVPMMESGPWETQLRTRNLNRVMEAIAEGGVSRGDGSRASELQDRRDDPGINDLRLLDPLLQVLDIPNGPSMEVTRDHLLPRFGSALAPELLRLVAESLEASQTPRRLAVLIRIEPEKTLPLIDQAFAIKDSGFRVKLLETLRDLLSSAAIEKYALPLVKEKSGELRLAAVTSLARSTSSESAIAMLDALPEMGWRAVSTIDGSTNPHLLDLALERLTAAQAESEKLKKQLAELKKAKKKGEEPAAAAATPAKGKKKVVVATVETVQAEMVTAANLERMLIRIIARHNAPRQAEVTKLLLETLEHTDSDHRAVALEGLKHLKHQPPEVRAALIEILRAEGKRTKKTERDDNIVEVFWALANAPADKTEEILEDTFVYLMKRLKGTGGGGDILVPVAMLVRQALREPKKWLPKLAQLTALPGMHASQNLLPIFGRLGVLGQPLLANLLAVCLHERYYYYSSDTHLALSSLDPTGTILVPEGIKLLKSKKDADKIHALHLLAQYRELPEVKALTAEIVPLCTDHEFWLMRAANEMLEGKVQQYNHRVGEIGIPGFWD